MSTLGKVYIETTVESEFIKLTLSFNRESLNWADSQPMAIGYRVTAIPIKKRASSNPEFSIEESGAFTGFYEIVHECGRRSQKQEDVAWKKIMDNLPRYKKFFEAKGYKFPVFEEKELKLAL